MRATREHLNALVALENSLFPKDDFPLSRGSFSYHIKKNDLFVFMHEGEVAGYILWLKRKTYYRLYSLGVSAQCWGRGVAQMLLAYSFGLLKSPSYTLEVKTTNQRAISLYEKFGFTKQKILKNYYPNNRDGYLMRKQENDEIKKL
ncbi:GNAT family N-acetyltransferase [Sulfurovum sp. XTW-4]|uniref:GNAT family N-acetyltransferase n=1 Tax=Sulfurovum xiamenensis TaxID=3019066 RepID=A0ABT7QR71_9BACT|nr:GNAT family N-acetyltransferase [Sulfurovum xiamenensis]MDM5263595.1 GNAT family N-acetyltransferase [Sulfurovum xiamenensis]